MYRSTVLSRSARTSLLVALFSLLLLIGTSVVSATAAATTTSRAQEEQEKVGLWEGFPPPRSLQEDNVEAITTTNSNATDVPLLEDSNATAVEDEDHDGNSTAVEGEDHDDHAEEDDHDDHAEEEDDHDHEEDSSTTTNSELAEEGSASKPWGEVIVAALLINLITLVGVLFLSGEFVAKRVFQNEDIASSTYYHTFTHNIIPSFACGALLATTVFLVLPEALYLITAHFTTSETASAAAVGDDDHAGHDHRFLQEAAEEEEHEDPDVLATWRFGTCIICGFLLPVLTSALFPHRHDHAAAEQDGVVEGAGNETDQLTKKDDVIKNDNDTLEEQAEVKPPKSAVSESDDISDVVVRNESGKLVPRAIDWPLAASIMAGDFFHNFAGTYQRNYPPSLPVLGLLPNAPMVPSRW